MEKSQEPKLVSSMSFDFTYNRPSDDDGSVVRTTANANYYDLNGGEKTVCCACDKD